MLATLEQTVCNQHGGKRYTGRKLLEHPDDISARAQKRKRRIPAPEACK